jgi:hypothetical protein
MGSLPGVYLGAKRVPGTCAAGLHVEQQSLAWLPASRSDGGRGFLRVIAAGAVLWVRDPPCRRGSSIQVLHGVGQSYRDLQPLLQRRLVL